MMEADVYKRSGSTVEAMQYMPIVAHHVAAWCGGVQIPPVQAEPNFGTPRNLHIFSPTGVSVARYGDYVVKDPFGKFYACPQKVFEHVYEKVSV